MCCKARADRARGTTQICVRSYLRRPLPTSPVIPEAAFGSALFAPIRVRRLGMTALSGGNENLVALLLDADPQPAGAGQEPGIEGLDRVRVD